MPIISSESGRVEGERGEKKKKKRKRGQAVP